MLRMPAGGVLLGSLGVESRLWSTAGVCAEGG